MIEIKDLQLRDILSLLEVEVIHYSAQSKSNFLQVHIEKQINFILAKHAFQYPESMIFSGFKSLWTCDNNWECFWGWAW